MRRKAKFKSSVLVNSLIFQIAVVAEGLYVKARVKSAKRRRKIGVFSSAILGPGIIVLAVND